MKAILGKIIFAFLSLLPCSMAADLSPVFDLVKRVTPDAVEQVAFNLDEEVDGFTLDNREGKLIVTAPSVNNLTAGYGYFLRHFEHAHFSWNGNRLPKRIHPERISEPVHVKQPWQWRFAYNYCALTYTSAFWGTREWEEEIDRMALNGLSHMLVQAGLETVWSRTLSELGYPEDRIRSFIPNPSGAAWWNMGNFEGHGGPVTDTIINGEAQLGRFIVDRLRALGIVPVLQGYVGIVPIGLKDHYKKGDVRYIEQGRWGGGGVVFPRPSVLDPTTEAFQEVAAIWYRNLHEVYGGKTSAYAGDLFHEGGKTEGVNVSEAAKAVQSAMQKASPGSTWMIQGWQHNPTKNLLDGLDDDKTVVISLVNNMKDGNDGKLARRAYGKQWIWGELMNFGGNHNFYGNLELLGSLDQLGQSPEKDKLAGLGMTSEGTETNPIYYELFFQRFWMPRDRHMTPDDIKVWLKEYALNRYGQAPPELLEALEKLERSIYSPVSRGQSGCTQSIMCARPRRNAQKASTWSTATVYYDTDDIVSAAQSYVTAAGKYPELLEQETFRYDLIDVVRQFTSDLARPLLATAMDAYDAGDEAKFRHYSRLFLDLMTDVDKLLGSYPQWRFGEMHERAVAKGKTTGEKENMALACKRLVTNWSGGIDTFNDYSHRQLAGLIGDFYKTRWQKFFDTYGKILRDRSNAQQELKHFEEDVRRFDLAWERCGKEYAAQPEGDTRQLAGAVLEKYLPVYQDCKKFQTLAEANRWTLRDGDGKLTFEVTDSVTEPGTYYAVFQWDKGKNALKIKSVALYEGDRKIAEDIHAGRTGNENVANRYALKIDRLTRDLPNYTLVAEVEGDGGRDSAGKLVFTKKKAGFSPEVSTSGE